MWVVRGPRQQGWGRRPLSKGWPRGRKVLPPARYVGAVGRQRGTARNAVPAFPILPPDCRSTSGSCQATCRGHRPANTPEILPRRGSARSMRPCPRCACAWVGVTRPAGAGADEASRGPSQSTGGYCGGSLGPADVTGTSLGPRLLCGVGTGVPRGGRGVGSWRHWGAFWNQPERPFLPEPGASRGLKPFPCSGATGCHSG